MVQKDPCVLPWRRKPLLHDLCTTVWGMNLPQMEPKMQDSWGLNEKTDSLQDVCDDLRQRRQALERSSKESRDQSPSGDHHDRAVEDSCLPSTKRVAASSPANSLFSRARVQKDSLRHVRSESFSGRDAPEVSNGRAEDEYSTLTHQTAPACSDLAQNPGGSSRKFLFKKRWGHHMNASKVKVQPSHSDRSVASREERSTCSEQVAQTSRRMKSNICFRRSNSLSPVGLREKNSSPSKGKGRRRDCHSKNIWSVKSTDHKKSANQKGRCSGHENGDYMRPAQRMPDLNVASLVREGITREGEVSRGTPCAFDGESNPIDRSPVMHGNDTIAALAKEDNHPVAEAPSFSSAPCSVDLEAKSSFSFGLVIQRIPVKSGEEPSHEKSTENSTLLQNEHSSFVVEKGENSIDAFEEAKLFGPQRKNTRNNHAVGDSQPRTEHLEPPECRNLNSEIICDDLPPRPPMHPSRGKSMRTSGSDTQGRSGSTPSACNITKPKTMKTVLKNMFSRIDSNSKHELNGQRWKTPRVEQETGSNHLRNSRLRDKFTGMSRRNDANTPGTLDETFFYGELEEKHSGESESAAAEMDVYECLSVEDKRAINKIRKYVIEAQSLLNKAATFMEIHPTEVEILTIKAFAYANEADKVAATLDMSPVWKQRGEFSSSASGTSASGASASSSINSFAYRVDREEHLRRIQGISFYDFGRSSCQALMCGAGGVGAASPEDLRSLAFETMDIMDSLNHNVTLPDLVVNRIDTATSPTAKLKWINFGKGTLSNRQCCGKDSRFRSSNFFDDIEEHSDRLPIATLAAESGYRFPGGWSARTSESRPDSPETLEDGDSLGDKSFWDTYSDTVGKPRTRQILEMADSETNEDSDVETLETEGEEGTYKARGGSVVSRSSSSTYYGVMEDVLDVVATKYLDKLCAGPREDAWYHNHAEYGRRGPRKNRHRSRYY